MPFITLPGHFDGQQIQLDDPYPLTPDTPLLITVLKPSSVDQESAQWTVLSLAGLTAAYGPDEPDYSSALLRERNPDHV